MSTVILHDSMFSMLTASRSLATLEELLELMFSLRSAPRLHKEPIIFCSEVIRAEAGSNTSTAALRVVGGEGKGTKCLGVYPGHPVPGGYK
jgi:hypothetical protein